MKSWSRRRARARATPRLKPLAYYRAVDLYARARAARSPDRAPDAREGVRILAYHRVADEPDVLAVRPAVFRAHMELLLASGATPIRLDAAVDLLARPVRGRWVCVTFDDGYRDSLELAAPILRELGIPATVFLATAIVDGRAGFDWYRRSPPPALSWDDVHDLVADGLIDVQSHSRTHPRLPVLGDEEVLQELAGSKADLERHVPGAVSTFCYPAGLYGAREARLVLDAGYRAAVTCRPGLNVGDGPLAELRRTMIGWADDPERFRRRLDGATDVPGGLTELMQRRRAGGRAPV